MAERAYEHHNLPLHVLPSPVNPGSHAHWNEPSTLVHTPSAEQSWPCVVHSSISMQFWWKQTIKLWGKCVSVANSYGRFYINLPMHMFPSPVKPDWHSHSNEWSTLVHMPFNEQLWVCVEHSSISKDGWSRLEPGMNSSLNLSLNL